MKTINGIFAAVYLLPQSFSSSATVMLAKGDEPEQENSFTLVSCDDRCRGLVACTTDNLKLVK